MNKKKLRKLQKAYAKLVAYDNEYGADEYIDEATSLLAAVLGKRAVLEAQRWVDEEYAGSGMSPNEG
jgi:hypothetical protein